MQAPKEPLEVEVEVGQLVQDTGTRSVVFVQNVFVVFMVLFFSIFCFGNCQVTFLHQLLLTIIHQVKTVNLTVCPTVVFQLTMFHVEVHVSLLSSLLFIHSKLYIHLRRYYHLCQQTNKI